MCLKMTKTSHSADPSGFTWWYRGFSYDYEKVKQSLESQKSTFLNQFQKSKNDVTDFAKLFSKNRLLVFSKHSS